MRLIILAAGQGTRLRPLTNDRPKCLVKLAGKSLLDWQLEIAERCGIKDVIVVGGFCAELLDRSGVKVVLNSRYAETNMVSSLFCAESFFGEEFILSYGDIVFSAQVFETILASSCPIGVTVDSEWQKYWEMRFANPLSDAESLRIGEKGLIESIGQKEEDILRIEAQYIGLSVFREKGIDSLRNCYDLAIKSQENGESPFSSGSTLENLYMTDLLQGMINYGVQIHSVPVNGGWMEIDSLEDLDIAEALVKTGRLER